MLHKNLYAALAFAALTLPAAGCSDSSAEEDRPKVLDSLLIELPYGESDIEFDNKPPLAVNASGEFALNGKVLSADEFTTYLAEQQKKDAPYLSVQIDEEAKLGDVVALLRPGTEETQIYVAQTTGGRFNREQIKRTDPVLERNFIGRIGDYHLPLIAGYVAEGDKCVLLLGGGGASILQGRNLDISELDQVATKFLDRYVEHHGGSEAVAAKPDVIKTLVARIQATADTPWRCVAAPLERANGIGWPVLSYEVVP